MLARLFPDHMDNAYRGYQSALWIFGFVVAVTLLQNLLSIFDASATLRTADGIPIATYGAAAAQTVVALFTLLGFAQLVIQLLCVVVLRRYRRAVPFMFCVLLFARLGAKVVLWFVPIARVGRPPGAIVGLVLVGLLLLGLALSLSNPRAAGVVATQGVGAA